MSRKYSVSEIDDLREVVEHKYLYGCYKARRAVSMSRSYSEVEKAKVVEEQVRTHMLAGHIAADLEASEEERIAAFHASKPDLGSSGSYIP